MGTGNPPRDRAVLKTLREPTPEMVEAGHAAGSDPAEIWSAMVRAAIGQEETVTIPLSAAGRDAFAGMTGTESRYGRRAMPGAPLTLYNSLTRSLEPFEPIDPANVRVYSCGPTVYNYAHIGNLRAYVFTDTLSRVLTWKGYPPHPRHQHHRCRPSDLGRRCRRRQDGGGRARPGARASGTSPRIIPRRSSRTSRDLNIREPSALVGRDRSYRRDDRRSREDRAEALLRARQRPLFRRARPCPITAGSPASQDDEREGRIDPVEGKRHPQDFAIWRKSPPGEQRQMEWDSPWGTRRARLAPRMLGDEPEISRRAVRHPHRRDRPPRDPPPQRDRAEPGHCGCADTGAHFWMHNNFLVERAGKMSKSSGRLHARCRR